MPTKTLEDVVAILRLIDGFADHKYCDLKDAIWWRCTKDEYAPITFFINCNDLFYWACSDSEELTADKIPSFDKCFEDVRIAAGVNDPKKLEFPRGGTKEEQAAYVDYHEKWWSISGWAPTLWCCRQRGMRPQNPFYESIPTELHDLFNACGPERTAAECG